MIDTRTTEYLLPKAIKSQSDNCINSDCLLTPGDPVINLYEPVCFEARGKGHIILDFGQELGGGIRILTCMSKNGREIFPMRIRFGESLGEACSEIGENGSTNNHAIRDMEVITTDLSDQMFGDTGFRFVRIDFLKDTVYPIKKIYAVSRMHSNKQINYFQSEDKRLNDIFNIAKHTVDLCTQNYIFDGIKRDRLVWVGDMEPEVRSLLHLYGNIPQIEGSINVAEMSNPQPRWMNGIPSYSCWYLQILNDVYEFTGDKEFIQRHVAYAKEALSLFEDAVMDNGELSCESVKRSPSDFYFIDWPTSEASIEERKDANKNLLIYVLRNIANGFAKLDEELLATVNAMLSKLQMKPTGLSKIKTFAAFHYLVNKDDESYNTLIEGGAKGLSTFMSYFILTAIADRDKEKAIEIMKDYYGAMIDMGATSFWEDFNIEWTANACRIDEFKKAGQKDIHGDFGRYCYVGNRHSLCHGWSSGPVSFLLENEKTK